MGRSAKQTCRVNRATKVMVIILSGTLIVTLISFYALGQEENQDTIQMVSILFRHGEKNPTSFYPDDKYASMEWPGGLGALTPRGSLQSYNLGRNLRKRYYSLLPTDGVYTQNNMKVLSSYAERCIMSAQSLLAGLLPPGSNSSLPIPWQPVPVTSLSRLEDTLLAQKKPCALYERKMNSIREDPSKDYYYDGDGAYDELYVNLSLHTGMDLTTVGEVESLYNTLKAEQDIGLTLPKWTEEYFPDKMLPLVQSSYALFTHDTDMKRIKGGAFLNEVYQNMLKKATKNLTPNRNIFLYAGHDVTLVNVMNSMGILSQTSRLPDYSSTLVFELHMNQAFAGPYEVRMFYYDDSNVNKPRPIQIPNCQQPCHLQSFRKSIDHLLFDDYDAVCQNPTP